MDYSVILFPNLILSANFFINGFLAVTADQNNNDINLVKNLTEVSANETDGVEPRSMLLMMGLWSSDEFSGEETLNPTDLARMHLKQIFKNGPFGKPKGSTGPQAIQSSLDDKPKKRKPFRVPNSFKRTPSTLDHLLGEDSSEESSEESGGDKPYSYINEKQVGNDRSPMMDSEQETEPLDNDVLQTLFTTETQLELPIKSGNHYSFYSSEIKTDHNVQTNIPEAAGSRPNNQAELPDEYVDFPSVFDKDNNEYIIKDNTYAGEPSDDTTEDGTTEDDTTEVNSSPFQGKQNKNIPWQMEHFKAKTARIRRKYTYGIPETNTIKTLIEQYRSKQNNNVQTNTDEAIGSIFNNQPELPDEEKVDTPLDQHIPGRNFNVHAKTDEEILSIFNNRRELPYEEKVETPSDQYVSGPNLNVHANTEEEIMRIFNYQPELPNEEKVETPFDQNIPEQNLNVHANTDEAFGSIFNNRWELPYEENVERPFDQYIPEQNLNVHAKTEEEFLSIFNYQPELPYEENVETPFDQYGEYPEQNYNLHTNTGETGVTHLFEFVLERLHILRNPNESFLRKAEAIDLLIKVLTLIVDYTESLFRRSEEGCQWKPTASDGNGPWEGTQPGPGDTTSIRRTNELPVELLTYQDPQPPQVQIRIFVPPAPIQYQ